MALEVGDSVLRAHVRKENLPPDSIFSDADKTAVGFSASMEQSVWGTKERLPLMLTLGQHQSRDNERFLCETVQQHSRWSDLRDEKIMINVYIYIG